MYRALALSRCSLSTSTSRHQIRRSTLPLTKATHDNLSSLTPGLLFRRSAHILSDYPMSHLPPKPSLDLSLPPRLVNTSITASSISTKLPIPAPSLLFRISTTLPHGLPPKPSTVVPPPTFSSRTHTPPPLLRDTNTYEPRGKVDTYFARSPSPEHRETYRSRSPLRSDWDKSDSYIAKRSPSPPPPRSRYKSVDRRRSSFSSRSHSPVKGTRSASPEPLPKSFFTRSHKFEEQKEELRREKEELRKEKEAERKAAWEVRDAARRKQKEEEEKAWIAQQEEAQRRWVTTIRLYRNILAHSLQP